MKFKIGDRVICQQVVDNNKEIVNKHGIVIGIISLDPSICVEFDENVGGHNGCNNRDIFTNNPIRGKRYHCWYVYESSIKIENKNRRISK